jgi:hypothetical protein
MILTCDSDLDDEQKNVKVADCQNIFRLHYRKKISKYCVLKHPCYSYAQKSGKPHCLPDTLHPNQSLIR